MALKLKITADEFQGLDEGIRGLYEEKDGGYVLSVDGIEDTGGLKSALEKERKAARESERAAKAYRDLGLTPEQIQEIVRANEASEAEKAERKGDWEKLRAQMNEKHAKDLSAKDEEIKRMRAALERYLVDSAATAAIAELKGIPQLLLPVVKSSVRVVEENGEYRTVVVAPDGTPRVNGRGEPLQIKDHVAELRQDPIYGRAFDGSGNTGGGAPTTNPNPSGAMGANPFKPGPGWNLTRQGQIYRENPELARKMADEAGARI